MGWVGAGWPPPHCLGSFHPLPGQQSSLPKRHYHNREPVLPGGREDPFAQVARARPTAACPLLGVASDMTVASGASQSAIKSLTSPHSCHSAERGQGQSGSFSLGCLLPPEGGEGLHLDCGQHLAMLAQVPLAWQSQPHLVLSSCVCHLAYFPFYSVLRGSREAVTEQTVKW